MATLKLGGAERSRLFQNEDDLSARLEVDDLEESFGPVSLASGVATRIVLVIGKLSQERVERTKSRIDDDDDGDGERAQHSTHY